MDKIQDSGSCDMRSIRIGGTVVSSLSRTPTSLSFSRAFPLDQSSQPALLSLQRGARAPLVFVAVFCLSPERLLGAALMWLYACGTQKLVSVPREKREGIDKGEERWVRLCQV